MAAGASVRGFDPAGGADVAGVQRAPDARAAVDGSDVVLSVTAASAALAAAGDARADCAQARSTPASTRRAPR